MLQRIASSLRSFFSPAVKDAPVFISFDVEALLIRAPDDHVNRLIWGKTAGGEYGIRRLSDILRQHKLRGNFLVDLAACHIHGEKKVQEVFDFLLGEGHEVHAHLHPEMLADSWKHERTGVKGRRFDDLDRFMTESLMKYTAQKFRDLARRDPFLFRSGSYLFNRHTVDAAKSAGFSALSNYNVKRHDAALAPDSLARRMDPFCWDNGVIEVPVDISSPERLTWHEFQKRWSVACRSKDSKIFNLVSHSWTLLKRDENGHFMDFAPELEERFHRICEGLSGKAQVLGYEEYLTKYPPEITVERNPLPSIVPFRITKARRCLSCFAIMSPDVLEGKICKNCGSERVVAFDSETRK